MFVQHSLSGFERFHDIAIFNKRCILIIDSLFILRGQFMDTETDSCAAEKWLKKDIPKIKGKNLRGLHCLSIGSVWSMAKELAEEEEEGCVSSFLRKTIKRLYKERADKQPIHLNSKQEEPKSL